MAFAALSIGIHLVFAQALPETPDFLKGMSAYIGLNLQAWYGEWESYSYGHWACSMSKTSVVLTPLFLNLLLTATFSVVGYIDAAVLRWALWTKNTREDSIYASNPRLFTPVKGHAPLSWYTNLLSGTALVLAYGATNTLTLEVDVIGITAASNEPGDAKPFDGPHHGLDFNGLSLIFIGACLLVQFLITSWNVMWNPALVRTWSSNPLVLGRAARQFPQEKNLREDVPRSGSSRLFPFSSLFQMQRSGRFMVPIFSQTTLATEPTRDDQFCSLEEDSLRQPNLHNTCKHVRHLKIALWLLVALSIVAVIIVAIFASHHGANSNQFVHRQGHGTDVASYWQWYGYLFFPYAANYYTIVDDQRVWLGILLQSIFQAPITLALHCTSIIIGMNMDELSWRQVTSKTGARIDGDPIFDALRNWPAWIFFVFKAVLQWIFGYVIYSSQLLVSVSLIPLATLSALLLLLGVACELLTRWRPKGPLPGSWGNIGLLAELIGKAQGEGEYLYWNEDKQELEAGPKR